MAGATFNTERHVKYYLRCLKTFLPTAYISSDSSRMLLAYLTLSGLDVLGALQSKTTREERQGYIDWLYHCQVPSGGFRGFSGTDFGEAKRTAENEVWDPANVPATFFALVNLLILGDDLSRVKRRECLQWLPKLQREDGSFAGVRYILRGKSGKDTEDIEDIDVSNFISFIEACQAYDGGMGESPFRESHSGHTYCAVGALDFLRRAGDDIQPVQLLRPGSGKFESLVGWLASRQTSDLGEDEDDEEERTPPTQDSRTGSAKELPSIAPIAGDTIPCAGFNGRCNKVADTCYSFWNGATLMMLNRYSVIDDARNRRYLLEKTQHLVGGFGKAAGDPPDLLHSYFGLVSMAFQGEAGLARVDPALVTTERAVQHLASLPWQV